jgi:hypothetical protein
MNSMNNRTTILLLSAVLIASVLSGCVQENSEIGAPDAAPKAATPEAAPPAPTSEVAPPSMSAPPYITNWDYVSYRNLSISNAPALNQTARVTYSIVPDRDIEILLVYISFMDGFELVDVEGERLLTARNLERSAKWLPTNLSKGEMYQFIATIKAVKTGNFTIYSCNTKGIYLSVSEDSAYISDEPFPGPLRGRRINKSEFERMYANMQADVQPTYWWNGTAWIEIENPPKNMIGPYWNGTEWVERKNQS